MTTTNQPAGLAAQAGQYLTQLRQEVPLVQCITNQVVTNVTANALLALGAAPAMVDIPEEAGLFASMASGLLINLGTPIPSQVLAAVAAAKAANEAGTPWVLDPVAVGVLPVRTRLAQELLALNPTVIRGNASEILALAGNSAGGRGVDATDSVEHAEHAADALATRTGGVVAVSGPIDYLTDGTRRWRIGNGTPLLTKVTGGGCALGSVMAAFLSLATARDDRLPATAAAVLVYTIAAELAANGARGPGSFAVAFLDQLHQISADEVVARANIL